MNLALALATAGVLLLTATPAARADTSYGGTGNTGSQATGPSMALVRKDDGRIVARIVSGYTCGKRRYGNRIVELSGTTPDGVSFSATGATTLSGKGKVRYTVTGTLAADTVTGTLTEGRSGCPRYSFGILLHSESAPAGAPAAPPGGSLFAGLTSQTAGGVRLGVAVRVTKQGRAYGYWQATLRCGSKTVPIGNLSPQAAVKADGTFSRSETFTVRYRGGVSEHYRVSFAGRFLADGVTGTLRARMQTRKAGRKYPSCDSGTQTWAARM